MSQAPLSIPLNHRITDTEDATNGLSHATCMHYTLQRRRLSCIHRYEAPFHPPSHLHTLLLSLRQGPTVNPSTVEDHFWTSSCLSQFLQAYFDSALRHALQRYLSNYHRILHDAEMELVNGTLLRVLEIGMSHSMTPCTNL